MRERKRVCVCEEESMCVRVCVSVDMVKRNEIYKTDILFISHTRTFTHTHTHTHFNTALITFEQSVTAHLVNEIFADVDIDLDEATRRALAAKFNLNRQGNGVLPGMQ
jgi:hypothetical protein